MVRELIYKDDCPNSMNVFLRPMPDRKRVEWAICRCSREDGCLLLFWSFNIVPNISHMPIACELTARKIHLKVSILDHVASVDSSVIDGELMNLQNASQVTDIAHTIKQIVCFQELILVHSTISTLEDFLAVSFFDLFCSMKISNFFYDVILMFTIVRLLLTKHRDASWRSSCWRYSLSI